MSQPRTPSAVDAGESLDADRTDVPRAVLTGSGELRRNTGAGAAYSGHIVLGEGTIGLKAEVAQDLCGRFFAITASINLDDFTQTELNRLLTAPTRRGAGLGGPRRLPPIGPIEDDPIPFGAA